MSNTPCRNHTSEAVFEREGKSDATEQGAGVEGCDPTSTSKDPLSIDK